MKRKVRLKWITILLMVIFVVVGCSDKSNESAEIDPPPYDLAALSEQWETTDPDGTDERTSTFHATIYAADADGYLAPMSMDIPFVERTATQTLAYMTKGGPGEQLLPDDFQMLLPEDTEVIGMDIAEGLATIDFSPEFANYEPEVERQLLESIVWTLTEHDNIQTVQIWMDGRPLKEMPVGGLPMSYALSRTMGINLEYAHGVHPSEAMPVTLYFQNESSDLGTYFVPVTRMIKKTETVFADVVQQLISGPTTTKGLKAIAPSETQLLNVTERDGTVELKFSESVLGDAETISAQMLQSLTLSLIETTDADKIEVQIDGYQDVMTSD